MRKSPLSTPDIAGLANEKERLLTLASNLYHTKRLSLQQAARMTDLSVQKFLTLIANTAHFASTDSYPPQPS